VPANKRKESRKTNAKAKNRKSVQSGTLRHSMIRSNKHKTPYLIFAFNIGTLGHQSDDIIRAAIPRGFRQLVASNPSNISTQQSKHGN
jgi:hypothetical protein